MTLGELKIACYKIINPTDEEMYVDEISMYESNVNYSYYFLNMLPSINGAISRIVQELILPIKKGIIDASEYYDNESKYTVQISLSEALNDIYKIRHIEYEDEYGNRSRIGYRLVGNYLDIEKKSSGRYVVYYYPRINLLETYTDMYSGLLNGINDNLASIIPLYVKGDLLEHDKPSEAIIAKNTFDQYIQSFEQEELDATNSSNSSSSSGDGSNGVSCWWKDWLL